MKFSTSGLLSSALLLSQAAAQGTSGCGIPRDFPGETRAFTMESNAGGGGTRAYRVHLPPNYQHNTPTPLLVAYHGAGGNGAGFEAATGYANNTLNPNMITVFPSGINGNWQGPSYATPGISDEVFTTQLVNHIKGAFCIDSSRVYAVGYSNGGGFVGLLACSERHGGQFAAFGSYAAALYTDVTGDVRCSPARSPIPFIEIHGTADATIPYNGGTGRGGPLPSIPDWLSRWSTRNRCTGSNTVDRGNGVTDQTWACPGGSNVIHHIRLQGQSHAYPGPTHPQVYATRSILNYLTAQRRPTTLGALEDYIEAAEHVSEPSG